MIEPKERLRGDLADRAQVTIAQTALDGIASAQRSLAQAGSADCAACGQPIAPQRRAALPSARRCTACQSQFEQTHGATR